MSLDAKTMMTFFHGELHALRAEISVLPSLSGTKITTAREYSSWLVARMHELSMISRVCSADRAAMCDGLAQESVALRFGAVHAALREVTEQHGPSDVIELPIVDLLALVGTSVREVA